MRVSFGGRCRLLGLLLVAALFLSACSCEGVPRVVDLGWLDGNLAASVLDDFDGIEETYVSDDGGHTWQRAEGAAPPGAGSSCVDGTCFRVIDNRVEVDRGNGTWETAWSIPVERTDFVRRLGGGLFSCGDGGTDMRFTSDVIAVTGPGGITGVVGMGDQGVVIVDSTGLVDRVGVNYLEPTPFTRGFSGYGIEMVLVLFAAALLTALLSAIALASTQRVRHDGGGRIPVALGLIAPLVLVGLAVVEPTFVGALLLVIPIALIGAWSGIAKAIPGRAAGLFGIVLLAAVGSSVAALVPFELFARGLLNSYGIVTRLALLVGFVGVIVSIGVVRVASVRAADLPVSSAPAGAGLARSGRDDWRDPFTFDG